MSLIAWVPCITDLRNQGLNGAAVTSGGTPTYSSTGGKLGGMYTTNTGDIRVPYTALSTNKLSITFWCKINGWSAWTDIFTMSGSKNRIEQTNTDQSYQWYADSNALIGTGTSLGTITTGVWHFFAFTFDGSTATLTVDGVEKTKKTGVTVTIAQAISGNRISFGSRDNTSYCNASYNDIRIYDHCLSAQEVKEISKGLVAHYTLGQECAEGAGLTNLYTGNYAQGYCTNVSTMTRTKVDNYTNYVLSYTGTGNNSWPYLLWTAATETPTIGAKYVWTCKVRVNSCSDGARSVGLVMRNSLRDNDYTDGGASISLAVANLGKWITYNRTITIPEKCSQGNVDPKPRLEFYWGNCNGNGTNYSCNFDVMESAIYKSDYVCTLVPPSKFSPYIYDSSGYCRNGTVNGALNLCDSIRYNKAIEGNGNITLNGITINNPFTISMWIYFPVTGTIGSNGREIRIGPVTIYKATTTVDNHAVVFTKSDSSLLYAGLTDPAHDNWYHIVIISDGNNIKIYKNSSIIRNYQDITLKEGMTVCSLMENYNIKLSDVRIYATALSADDVSDLYKLGAQIS